MSTQPAYRCETCGMTAHTDDLTVIGRNCFATDFEHAHVMVTDTPTPGDDWRDDAATYGGYSQVFLAIEAPAAVGDRSAAPLDSTDFSLTGEQARVAFTALAEHADGTRPAPLSDAARSYLSDLFDVDGGENCTDAVHAEVRAWLAAQRGTPADGED